MITVNNEDDRLILYWYITCNLHTSLIEYRLILQAYNLRNDSQNMSKQLLSVALEWAVTSWHRTGYGGTARRGGACARVALVSAALPEAMFLQNKPLQHVL